MADQAGERREGDVGHPPFGSVYSAAVHTQTSDLMSEIEIPVVDIWLIPRTNTILIALQPIITMADDEINFDFMGNTVDFDTDSDGDAHNSFPGSPPSKFPTMEQLRSALFSAAVDFSFVQSDLLAEDDADEPNSPGHTRAPDDADDTIDLQSINDLDLDAIATSPGKTGVSIRSQPRSLRSRTLPAPKATVTDHLGRVAQQWPNRPETSPSYSPLGYAARCRPRGIRL